MASMSHVLLSGGSLYDMSSRRPFAVGLRAWIDGGNRQGLGKRGCSGLRFGCKRCSCLGLLFEGVVEAVKGDSVAVIWGFEEGFRLAVGQQPVWCCCGKKSQEMLLQISSPKTAVLRRKIPAVCREFEGVFSSKKYDGSAAEGDDGESTMNTAIVGIAWEVVGGWMAAAKVEEQRSAKIAALIPNDRTPKDSIVGTISVGDQPPWNSKGVSPSLEISIMA
ncbi:hypothetical protein BHE74_00019461 [Ensete ventricosum]|nr:hypothetical protein BHE74_00019461 [Ensete ventricosum]